MPLLDNDGHVVSVVQDGRAVLDEVRRNPPDLIVLDLMMPRVDGWGRLPDPARRVHWLASTEADTLVVGALSMDINRHEATIRGTPVSCAAGEHAILAMLMSRPGQVFTRHQLLEGTHGAQNITSRTIDVHVSNLRRKIESGRHPLGSGQQDGRRELDVGRPE